MSTAEYLGKQLSATAKVLGDADVIKMSRFVDAHNAYLSFDVDFIDAARRLRKSPISGQRLIKQLQQ
jgi:hypothetical protein